MTAFLKGEKLNLDIGLYGLGRKKMKAANALMGPERKASKQSRLRSRNAYREAIGLPAIEENK